MILHADMDAFYASIEQRDTPEYRGRPIAVGGIGPRGVVSAASYEARPYGVRSAMPTVEARKRCPDLIVIPGDIARYRWESKRVFEIFEEFSPSIEGISLDEAFLDLVGTERLMGEPQVLGKKLRQRVRERLGLPVSVGIAPVKMVAKIASEEAKPDGLVQVQSGAVAEFLAPLPVRRIWGVGPVGEKTLQAAGFKTLGDLARASQDDLVGALGDWGLAVGQLARGEDARDVEPYREAVSISEENTFTQDVVDGAVVDATLFSHAESVARRLRRGALRARTVVLKWKGATRIRPGAQGYPLFTRRVTLNDSTNDGPTIAAAARALWSRAAFTQPVRLLGVGVTNLVDMDEHQLSLFDSVVAEPQRGLNDVLDRITDRFGNEAIGRGHRRSVERAGLTQQDKRGEK